MREDHPDHLLTTREAATYLSVGRTTFLRLVREGHVPFVAIPGLGERRFRLSSLQEIASAHESVRPANGEAL